MEEEHESESQVGEVESKNFQQTQPSLERVSQSIKDLSDQRLSQVNLEEFEQKSSKNEENSKQTLGTHQEITVFKAQIQQSCKDEQSKLSEEKDLNHSRPISQIDNRQSNIDLTNTNTNYLQEQNKDLLSAFSKNSNDIDDLKYDQRLSAPVQMPLKTNQKELEDIICFPQIIKKTLAEDESQLLSHLQNQELLRNSVRVSELKQQSEPNYSSTVSVVEKDPKRDSQPEERAENVGINAQSFGSIGELSHEDFNQNSYDTFEKSGKFDIAQTLQNIDQKDVVKSQNEENSENQIRDVFAGSGLFKVDKRAKIFDLKQAENSMSLLSPELGLNQKSGVQILMQEITKQEELIEKSESPKHLSSIQTKIPFNQENSVENLRVVDQENSSRQLQISPDQKVGSFLQQHLNAASECQIDITDEKVTFFKGLKNVENTDSKDQKDKINLQNQPMINCAKDQSINEANQSQKQMTNTGSSKYSVSQHGVSTPITPICNQKLTSSQLKHVEKRLIAAINKNQTPDSRKFFNNTNYNSGKVQTISRESQILSNQKQTEDAEQFAFEQGLRAQLLSKGYSIMSKGLQKIDKIDQNASQSYGASVAMTPLNSDYFIQELHSYRESQRGSQKKLTTSTNDHTNQIAVTPRQTTVQNSALIYQPIRKDPTNRLSRNSDTSFVSQNIVNHSVGKMIGNSSRGKERGNEDIREISPNSVYEVNQIDQDRDIGGHTRRYFDQAKSLQNLKFNQQRTTNNQSYLQILASKSSQKEFQLSLDMIESEKRLKNSKSSQKLSKAGQNGTFLRPNSAINMTGHSATTTNQQSSTNQHQRRTGLDKSRSQASLNTLKTKSPYSTNFSKRNSVINEPNKRKHFTNAPQSQNFIFKTIDHAGGGTSPNHNQHTIQQSSQKEQEQSNKLSHSFSSPFLGSNPSQQVRAKKTPNSKNCQSFATATGYSQRQQFLNGSFLQSQHNGGGVNSNISARKLSRQANNSSSASEIPNYMKPIQQKFRGATKEKIASLKNQADFGYQNPKSPFNFYK